MKKRQILIPAFCTLLLSYGANATDQANIEVGFAYDMGFGLSTMINNKTSLMLGTKGISADYHLIKGTFDNNVPFTWYIAGGGYHQWNDGFGARLPLGLNIKLRNNQQNWNAYTQIAPSVGLDGDNDLKFDAQFSLGIRYSF